MIIARKRYLARLLDHRHNGLVKIITGVRRCGKSYLLFELYRNHLLQEGIAPDHIIAIPLDDRTYKAYRDPDYCLQQVKAQIRDGQMYYLFLDEVQLMPEFEDVLNSLIRIKNLDVYVTGSNSKFLSKDIITEFRGRGDEIRIYPLSFAEFYSVKESDWENAWREYYTFGGLPLILQFSSNSEKTEYLKKLFDETYLLDLIERNGIKNEAEFEELLNIVASSIGSLINPEKLCNSFKSMKNITLSAPTIKKYLDYLEEAFLISKAIRYDVKGKKYIATPAKFYFTDVGLRNVRLGLRQQEESHIMENIIYNELRMRGYSVDVGSITLMETQKGQYIRKPVEIDFIANLGHKRYYIQSALHLADPEKQAQEERSLKGVEDSFKKVIVVRDNIMPKIDENGILTLGIKDFLLDENGLDL